MRAALDTVVFVSCLLSTSDRQTTVIAAIDAALAGDYDLLLPNGLPDEPIESVGNKRTLSRVIDLDDTRDVTAAVPSFGRLLPYPIPTPGHP